MIVRDLGALHVAKGLESLPERTLRSGVSLAGGVLREATELLVPQAFQSSATYETMIRGSLDFLCEDVGGVKRAPDPNNKRPESEEFVARKAVGNFVELAGIATLHISPLTILALFSDIAYGSQAYLQELAQELQKQGIIDDSSTIHSADDLLRSLAHVSHTAASAVNTPPLSIDGLKQTIQDTRDAVKQIDVRDAIPQAEIQGMWQEMHEIAEREGVNLLQLSSAMTLHTMGKVGAVTRGSLSSVKVAGSMVNRHVFGHYRQALSDIRTRGIYQSLSDSASPYIESVWHNYSTERPTLTGDVLTGRIFGRMWGGVRGMFARGETPAAETPVVGDAAAAEGEAAPVESARPAAEPTSSESTSEPVAGDS